MEELPDGPIAFRGVVDLDRAGLGSGGMLYPAYGVAGFLAAIATHATLVERSKKAQKSKLQEEADMVVAPYLDVIKDFRLSELQQSACALAHQKSQATGSKEIGSGLRVRSLPIFSITQDHRALVMDDSVTVHAPNSSIPARELTIRVISPARQGKDITEQWTAEKGAALKATCVEMLAEGLRIAVESKAAAEDTPFKTFRFREGSKEKMERAQLVAQRGDRILIRTLRGCLMSVPHPEDGPAAGTSSLAAAPATPTPLVK